MFSEPGSKTSPWVDIDTTKIHWFIRWCSEFKYILNSQSNLQQVFDSKVNIACIAIYVPDPAMTQDSLIVRQAEGTLSAYLNPARIAKINSGQLKPYPDLVHEDLFEVLLKPQRFGIGNKKVIPLTKAASYKENDVNTLYVVFSIEGFHSLSGTAKKQDIQLNNVLQNLEDLRNKGIPVISVNLTHLEQYPFCNHAYGILFVNSPAFKPTGNRVSNDGVAIIKHCYQRRILVDIKHASLGARRMIIEDIRHRPDFTQINQPLVCTHAGFTGLSYQDIPDYVLETKKEAASSYIKWAKPDKYFYQNHIAFNPSSINLYDEEIAAILHSNGMIGLSLDKRVLGFTEADRRPKYAQELSFEEEYVSNSELGYFLWRNYGAKANSNFCITNKDVADGGMVNPNVSFYHLKHFMAHVGHLIFVANKYNYSVQKALQQVCIGSDFDGMINPVWCCNTIKDFHSLEMAFTRYFPFFLKANKNAISLPFQLNIKKVARQLFYENGKNFVLERIELL